MKRFITITSLALAVSFAFPACETPGQTAMLGAATGAAIGASRDRRGSDALRGAAIGAGAGYLVGRLLQHERRRAYDEGYYEGRGDYDGFSGRYPVADRTGRRGFVRSPYRPYHIIDVRGIPPGAKVVDPSCEKVFINP